MADYSLREVFKQFGKKIFGSCVNSCVSESQNLPLAASQGKVLQDQITQLNSNLGITQDIINTQDNGFITLKFSGLVITRTVIALLLPCSQISIYEPITIAFKGRGDYQYEEVSECYAMTSAPTNKINCENKGQIIINCNIITPGNWGYYKIIKFEKNLIFTMS